MASQNGKLLSVEDILNAKDSNEVVVEVPEWGGSVKVRSITKGTQQKLRESSTDKKGEINASKLELLLFVYGLAEPQFTEGQIEQLKEKSSVAFDKVLQAIMEIGGFNVTQTEAERSFSN